MRRLTHYLSHFRVKLPKTFLAVNLSDAFTFQEKPQSNTEGDALEIKPSEHEGQAEQASTTTSVPPSEAPEAASIQPSTTETSEK